MVKTKEMSLEEYRKMPGKKPTTSTGQQADEILKKLKPEKPLLVENASRGLQVALSRRINKNWPNVEMKVDRKNDHRDIALLLHE